MLRGRLGQLGATPGSVELVPRLAIHRLDEGVDLPSYAHEHDAGLDLVAAEAVTLLPGGGRAAIATGIALAIPEGWAGLVLPRSGLAAKHGVTCLNAPGLIDAGYRGEVKVILVNHDPAEPFAVQRGDRIAQLVLVQTPAVQVFEVGELDLLGESERGEGGLGSSGR